MSGQGLSGLTAALVSLGTALAGDFKCTDDDDGDDARDDDSVGQTLHQTRTLSSVFVRRDVLTMTRWTTDRSAISSYPVSSSFSALWLTSSWRQLLSPDIMILR